MAGIVSFPATLWYVPESEGVLKFQCIAVTSDTHTEMKGLGIVSGEVRVDPLYLPHGFHWYGARAPRFLVAFIQGGP